MFKKYKWNFVLLVLIVSIIGFIIFDLIIYYNIKSFLFNQTLNEMRMKTQLAVSLLQESRFKSLAESNSDLYSITYQIRNIVNSRITIIDSTGRVLSDSDVAQDRVQNMDNHLNRPEIKQANTEGWGQNYRISDTVKRKILYTAFPIQYNQKTIGFLRLAYYAQSFEVSMSQIRLLIIGATFLGLITLFLASLYFGHVATAPILNLVASARKISSGDLDKNFPVRSRDEIGTLSVILNELTEKLKSQISQLSDERSKLQDILTDLEVGIIVLDHHKNIIHANSKVFQILDIENPEVVHKNILEVIRYEPLTTALNRTSARGNKETGEFEFFIRDQKAFLYYIVTPFYISDEKANGALLQLYDITEIKRLEAIRRNFVTNASHELKTPLTSIVGYAETLLEGASERPSDRIKFIRRIREQAQRLEFLIADLLKLSEYEREQPLELKSCNLVPIVQDTVQGFKERSKQNQIEISVQSPSAIKVKINEEGIRSVLNNLIDNALKYTPQNGKITVQISEGENDSVKVEVIDNGIGIDPKYHERIFQRFYRIDKARFRALGGTGLGLAIVKHIIDRHGSKIHVQSELGKGSNFWFELEKD